MARARIGGQANSDATVGSNRGSFEDQSGACHIVRTDLSEEPMREAKRWKRRPENSTWGDYGPDDQLGRMNELTPEKVKQGIAEVKEGKTFCLSQGGSTPA
jgi:hypothetical protein